MCLVLAIPTLGICPGALASPTNLSSQDPQGLQDRSSPLRESSQEPDRGFHRSLFSASVQGRAWMLLLQPVLGREERSPLALVHLAEAAGRMRGHICPRLGVDIHPRRRGWWTPTAR